MVQTLPTYGLNNQDEVKKDPHKKCMYLKTFDRCVTSILAAHCNSDYSVITDMFRSNHSLYKHMHFLFGPLIHPNYLALTKGMVLDPQNSLAALPFTCLE